MRGEEEANRRTDARRGGGKPADRRGEEAAEQSVGARGGRRMRPARGSGAGEKYREREVGVICQLHVI